MGIDVRCVRVRYMKYACHISVPHAYIPVVTRQRNAQFTPPARQDKTVLSVSYQAV